MSTIFFKKIDNAALIVFRVLFGALIFLESIGAIFTGWVKKNLIDPSFTFTFIGFEFLQPLPGFGMYIYYSIMGLCALAVAFGFYYKYSLSLFTILWSATYLMQKTAYNNHYYLLILICLIMLFAPANRYFSLDVKQKRVKSQNFMPNWIKIAFVLQMFIIYTYAAIAKLYPDWLDHSVAKILMSGKKNYPFIGKLLQQEFVLQFMTYSGILFDLLIVPFMIYKPTRKIAFALAVFFHLFNSIVFQIGIFPYMALALLIFFYDEKVIQKLFLKRKPFYDKTAETIEKSRIVAAIFVCYFIIQIALPLRHHLIKGDVLTTEEGHRMSWRMMLRAKSGSIYFKVKNKATQKTERVNVSKYLTKKQSNKMSTKPDMIWQFAQHLKKEFAQQNQEVEIYAISKVNVNRKGWKPFIDPKIDLAATNWNYFGHNDFILIEE